MDQFNKLVTWINNNSNNNFTINEHDTSSILKNAWLRPRKFKRGRRGKGKDRIEARVRIEQRQEDPRL